MQMKEPLPTMSTPGSISAGKTPPPPPPPPPPPARIGDDKTATVTPDPSSRIEVPPPPPGLVDDDQTATVSPNPPLSSAMPPPLPTGDDDEHVAEYSYPSVTVPTTSTAPPTARPNPNVFLQTNYIPSGRVSFICPYCMREICVADMLYFCKRCKNAYTEKEAQLAGLGRAVKKQYYCHNESITANRICPNCKTIADSEKIHIENLRFLPKEVYSVKNEFRLCMTGYSSSGKTQYITQLMDYITKYSLPGIDAMFFLDDKTQKIKDAIRGKFFIDGKIAGTPSGYLDPLLFDIHNKSHSYVSVFYDIAGEDFQDNKDTLATRCIWNSRNIILVVDPTTLPGEEIQKHPRVRAFRSGIGKASPGEVIEPLNTYTGFVRTRHPRGERALNNVNLAIVFTKMDLFYDDDDLPDILKKESLHIKKDRFDVMEVDAVSNAMKHWIDINDGGSILRAMNHYSNVRIFGVSSGSDDLSKKSRTNRLLDPFLWLLQQNDII